MIINSLCFGHNTISENTLPTVNNTIWSDSNVVNRNRFGHETICNFCIHFIRMILKNIRDIFEGLILNIKNKRYY